MTEIASLIRIDVDPNESLTATWKRFSTALHEAGCDDGTIALIETAFYVGATQIVAAFDKAMRCDERSLDEVNRVMGGLYTEVVERMQQSRIIMHTEGNA